MMIAVLTLIHAPDASKSDKFTTVQQMVVGESGTPHNLVGLARFVYLVLQTVVAAELIPMRRRAAWR